MLLHLTELTGTKLVPHGYLPVAYFFTLTGFTFVYAYDARWSTMSLGAFFKRRLLRMHPLVIVASVIGLVALCFMPDRLFSFGQVGRPALWFVFLYSCLLLPAPATWGCIHVLQGQLWTLQYIYLANILYAFVLRHLKTWMLALLAVAAAVLSYKVGFAHHGLEAGWMLKEDHVIIALTRMAFPVLAGMVIARRGWKIPLGNFALPVTAVILGVIFVVPHIADAFWSGFFDATVTVIGIPLVLMMAIGGRIDNARVASVCRFLGRYSFPLYATHYPFRNVMMRWLRAHPDAPDAHCIAVAVGTAVVMLVFAWAAMKASEAIERKVRG